MLPVEPETCFAVASVTKQFTVGALGVNLVLNTSWSWIFFKAGRLVPAIVVAGGLAVSSIDLARRAGRASRATGIALSPYAAWCNFATVLTSAIWRRNRTSAG